MSQYSITALGNSLLDIEFQVSNDLLKELSIPKGHMTLVTRQEQDKIIHFLKNKGLSPKTVMEDQLQILSLRHNNLVAPVISMEKWG